MTTATMNEVSCPKCGGQMWDNRITKTNPKAPDFKCRNRSCDGVVWPPKGQRPGPARASSAPAPHDIGRTGIADLDADMAAEEQRFADQVRGAEQPDTSKVRLTRIFALQDLCFAHALTLAAKAEQNGVPVSLEGVSALTAQALIAFKDGR